jgi:predicted O-linked N-acetylglucosamine transferase (SPINDLY family)
MQTLTAQTGQLLRRALDCHRQGRWGQAEPLYRQILELDSGQPDALHLLGVLKNQMGDPAASAELIRRAVALEPGRVEYHNSLGNALRAQGDLRAAAASFEQALTLDPHRAEVFTNLGALMEEAGNLEDATLCYLRALEINPDYGDAHYTLANLLKRSGNLEEALKHYQQVIEQVLEYAPEALNNMGTTLRRLGRVEEAVSCFRRAIEGRAPYFEAHINLADALEQAGRLEEAAKIYQGVLNFQPDSPMAFSGAAGVLQDQGRPERATAAYRQACALAPANPSLHSNLLLHLHYDPVPAPADLLAAHREWGERHAAGLAAAARPHANIPNPQRRLRIGLVSPDFRMHPVGFFVAPLLACGLREGFEFVCYADVAAPDRLTERLRGGADAWRATWNMEDAPLAELIREERIDILVDLAGHTRGNRLLTFARKPAPIQVTWLGYPDTTGMVQMNYLISDRWQTPEKCDPYFTEKVVRMPDGYICYLPPDHAPPVTDLPARSAGHVTFGCFNRLSKVHPEVVRLWARLLQQCPGSRLVLRAHALADEAVARRYRRMFAREGVASSRVDLLAGCAHAELLSAYGGIDIALDPFPYSGGLSTCEALWMGVPVITMTAERMASRHSTSHLHNAGLPEMIAATPDEYVTLAGALAGDVDRLQALRVGLRQRLASSPLLDGERFTANLLAEFRGMWQRWCARA